MYLSYIFVVVILSVRTMDRKPINEQIHEFQDLQLNAKEK